MGQKGISEVENGHFVYLLQFWLLMFWNSVHFSLFGVNHLSIGDAIDQEFETLSLS